MPHIDAWFWILKLLSTAMGEAMSDYLVFHINREVAVIAGTAGFLVALVLQFAVRRYIAWVYWLLVVMIAIFGTMVADVTHIVLGVPFAASTFGFALALAIVFALWRRVEGTLSIHSIRTMRREAFYWATVICTFALGTAAGDMTASTMQLGYFVSGLLFTFLFVLPALCYRVFGLNAVFAFWFAYVVTRPMGASFADWFDKPARINGLGYGSLTVSVVLTILIVALVVAVSVTRSEDPGAGSANAVDEPDPTPTREGARP